MFVGIAVSIPYKRNSLQIIAILYLNMAMFLYQGHFRPLETRFMNRIEFFNETIIAVIYVHTLCFTDFVPTQDKHLLLGWYMCGLMFFMMVVNLVIVFYFGFKSNYLLYQKYKNSLVAYLNKKGFYKRADIHPKDKSFIKMEPDNEKVEEEQEIETHMDEIKEEEKVANIKKVPTVEKKKMKMVLRGINSDDKPYTKAE